MKYIIALLLLIAGVLTFGLAWMFYEMNRAPTIDSDEDWLHEWHEH